MDWLTYRILTHLHTLFYLLPFCHLVTCELVTLSICHFVLPCPDTLTSFKRLQNPKQVILSPLQCGGPLPKGPGSSMADLALILQGGGAAWLPPGMVQEGAVLATMLPGPQGMVPLAPS